MKNLTYFIVGFLLPFSLLFFASNSHAATFAAQAVFKAVPTTTGAIVSTEYAAMKAANQAVYAVRAVEVGKASVAAVVRQRSFTPWGVALTVAIVAAGYILEDDEIIKHEMLDDDVAEIGYSWQINGNIYRATRNEACRVMRNGLSGWTHEVDGNTCHLRDTNQSLRATYPMYYAHVSAPSYQPYYSPDAAVTDDELYQVASNMSPSQFQKLFEDPLSGQVNPDIQEFKDEAADLTSDYADQVSANPGVDPTVIPAKDGKPAAVLSPEKPKTEDPCVTNPSLLMCSELDDVPDETEIQEQEAEMDFSPHNFSSNASCPAPISLPYGAEMSYEFPCMFASGIKPIVLVVASLGALLIVGGFKEE